MPSRLRRTWLLYRPLINLHSNPLCLIILVERNLRHIDSNPTVQCLHQSKFEFPSHATQYVQISHCFWTWFIKDNRLGGIMIQQSSKFKSTLFATIKAYDIWTNLNAIPNSQFKIFITCYELAIMFKYPMVFELGSLKIIDWGEHDTAPIFQVQVQIVCYQSVWHLNQYKQCLPR